MIKPSDLNITGDFYTDSQMLERFSKDASSYKIEPSLVIAPKNEDDILASVNFARENGLGLTCRGGGSGLSGAGVGNGIILNLKKYLNEVLSVGEETIVQPGTILDDFLKQMSEKNLMLPAVPSSSALCVLGGNVGTRSTGPRTARYGTIDSFISSLKFITSRGEVVDTKQALPTYLAEGLKHIQREFQLDLDAQRVMQNRPFIAGGYNLSALLKYTDVRELAAHLLVGSVGTLGIVTELRLRLIDDRKSRGTFVTHFRNFDEFAEAANRLKSLNPAALEFSDASCSQHVNGKILNYSDSSIVGTLIAEFDESKDQATEGKEILSGYDVTKIWEIHSGSEEESVLWEDRRRILPSLWKYAREQKWILPSIIDDIAIHLKDFGAVHRDIENLMRELGHEISFFGHLGFGSIHARPYFDPTQENLVEQILKVSQETFNILRKYNGTLVGEHNAGRSRSVYLEQELGSAYRYTTAIKKLFDPDDLLNPGTVFNTAPIYENMVLGVT